MYKTPEILPANATHDFCATIWDHQREGRILTEGERPANPQMYYVYVSKLWAFCTEYSVSPLQPHLFGDYVECADADFDPSDFAWGNTLACLMREAESRGLVKAWDEDQEEGRREARFEKWDHAACERWIRGM